MRRLVVVLGGEIAVVAAIQHLAAPYWQRAAADPAGVLAASTGDLTATLLHGGAWLSAWWLLAGTVHDVVLALRDGRGRRRSRGRRVAPAWVQRIISQAVGSALVVGLVAGPAGAVGSADPDTTHMAQLVDPPVPILELPTPAVPDPDATGPAADPPADEEPGPDDPPEDPSAPADDPATAEEPSGDAAAGIHVVAQGENLWVIARQHAGGADGAAVSDRDVHAYWVRLVAGVRPDLRSGDPDLVFPGERLVLPAVTSVDQGQG